MASDTSPGASVRFIDGSRVKAAPAAPAVAHPQMALVTLCFAQLMITLDTTIVNVALPTIQDDLDFSDANLSWIVNGFLVTFGGFMLMAGRLGDLVGRRRVLMIGLVVFTVASALCGLAPGEGVLIGARLMQGVGAALQGAAILAIIATEFPRAKDRARAMSGYVFVGVAGASLGLLVGGVLTESLGWRWIFLVNVPIGIATIVVGRVLIPDDVGLGLDQGLDWAGSVLVTLAVMVGVFAVVGATDSGWGSFRVVGPGVLALALAAAFIVTEAKVANPVMPLRILRLRGLIGASVVRALIGTAMKTTLFVGALYLENTRGYSAVQTGFAFLPWFLTLGVLSLGVTARLVARFGPVVVMVAGALAAFLGVGLFSTAGVGTAYFPTIAIANFAIGTGIGLAIMPILTIAMDDVPAPDRGLGSGIINVAHHVGGALGLAVLSTLAATHTRSRISAGHPAAAAEVDGYQWAFVLAALGLVAAIVIVVVVLGRSPSASSSAHVVNERRKS